MLDDEDLRPDCVYACFVHAITFDNKTTASEHQTTQGCFPVQVRKKDLGKLREVFDRHGLKLKI